MNPALFADVSTPAHGIVYSLAHTLTAARYKVPTQWKDSMVTFTSSGSDLFVSFGDAGVMVGAGKVAQVTSETLAPHWGSGFVVPDGASVSFPVSKQCTHFSVDSTVASGYWSAYRSSGYPIFGDVLPASLPAPSLWLDFGVYSSLTISSGIAGAVSQSANRASFAEATNKPAWNDAASVGSGMMRPCAAFTAGSSHKLVCSDAAVAGLFDGTDAFTLFMPVRRGATGAVHTIFGVGSASANGYWQLVLDNNDDVLIQRVDSGGGTTQSVYATTVNTTPILLTYIFDGSTSSLYVNRVAVSLTGNANGDLGTANKVAVGCRVVNSAYANFATAEIPEVLAWNTALSTANLDKLHSWAAYRYGI